MENDVLEGVRKAASPKTEGHLSREQAFFNRQAEKGNLDAETTRAIKAGDMQYFDADYYFRKAVTAGQTEILNSGNVRRVGVSNLDKNSLPDLVNFVLGKMRLAYGNHATKTDPADISYANSGAIPNAIMNGEVQLLVDDKPIIDLPAARFFTNSSTATPHDVQGYFDSVRLDSLRLIKPGQPMIILFKAADSIAMPSGVNFVEVRLMGASNRKR